MKQGRNKTVFVFINLQYSVKYILQTAILDNLKNQFDQVVLITPNSKDKEFVSLYKDNNVFIEESNYKIIEKFQNRKINRFFVATRRFIYPKDCDFGTLDLKEKFQNKTIKHKKFSKKLFSYLSLYLAKILRKSITLRNYFLKLELLFYPSDLHNELYVKYKPDLVLVQDLGTIEKTNYHMHEGRVNKVPIIALILSWDNLTAKGVGALKPDYSFVWNERMRYELESYHEIDEESIFVNGNPVFDDHFSLLSKKNKDSIKKAEKIVLYATGSPGWFKDIAKSLQPLLEANSQGRIHSRVKFIVRMHPIFLMRSEQNEIFQKEVDELNALAERFLGDIELHYPELHKRKEGYEFKNQDILHYLNLLNGCDLLLTNFSTAMLEAAIFDKPIINIGYDSIRQINLKTQIACTAENHIKHVMEYNFSDIAKTEEEAIDLINMYFDNQDFKSNERKKLRDNYCGVNAGIASKNIVDDIFSIT